MSLVLIYRYAKFLKRNDVVHLRTSYRATMLWSQSSSSNARSVPLPLRQLYDIVFQIHFVCVLMCKVNLSKYVITTSLGKLCARFVLHEMYDVYIKKN